MVYEMLAYVSLTEVLPKAKRNYLLRGGTQSQPN